MDKHAGAAEIPLADFTMNRDVFGLSALALIIGAIGAVVADLLVLLINLVTNLAYYHGQQLQWDPAKNEFAGGTGNPEWLTREYRGEWKVA